MKFHNGLIIAAMAIIACLSGFALATEQPSPRLILISNVNIFDGKSEKLHTNMHVLVKNNLIETVSAEPLAVVQTDNVTMIDGGGRTLIPGLIDAHFHITYADIIVSTLASGDIYEIAIRGALTAEKTLMRGFTTVRDIGGNPFSIRKMIESGEIVGPRIYASGPSISQTAGHGDFRDKNDTPTDPNALMGYWYRNGLFMLADGVPMVLQRTRENFRYGADHIKILAGGGVSSVYDPLDVQQYTFEEMKAAVDVAKTYNTYVAAHIFTDDAVQLAIRAGVKSIEHGQLLKDPKTFEMMKANGVWLSAQPLLNDEDAFVFQDPRSTAKWLQMTDGTATSYRLAREIGVKIAYGTDLLFRTQEKQGKLLAKLAKPVFGFTPYEALKMATSDNAELLKMSGLRDPYPDAALGAIREGAYADMILVDGNPLENLDLVADAGKNFLIIMKNGVIYKNTLESQPREDQTGI